MHPTGILKTLALSEDSRVRTLQDLRDWQWLGLAQAITSPVGCAHTHACLAHTMQRSGSLHTMCPEQGPSQCGGSAAAADALLLIEAMTCAPLGPAVGQERATPSKGAKSGKATPQKASPSAVYLSSAALHTQLYIELLGTMHLHGSVATISWTALLPLQAAPKKGGDAVILDINLASYTQVALQANCMKALLLVCATLARALNCLIWLFLLVSTG